MYMAVRSYSGPGASELFNLLAEREDEIRELISGVPGFTSYTASRTGDDSGVTVTVCDDKAGTDESSRRAADWVGEHVSVTGTRPTISEGATIIDF